MHDLVYPPSVLEHGPYGGTDRGQVDLVALGSTTLTEAVEEVDAGLSEAGAVVGVDNNPGRFESSDGLDRVIELGLHGVVNVTGHEDDDLGASSVDNLDSTHTGDCARNYSSGEPVSPGQSTPSVAAIRRSSVSKNGSVSDSAQPRWPKTSIATNP